MIVALAFLLVGIDTSILDECKDARGTKVKVNIGTEPKQIAEAKTEADGTPVIEYNPKSVTWLHDKTRQFIFAHECAHHALAHLFSEITYAKEQQADCWGIQLLYHKGVLEEGDLSDIQTDIGRLTVGDATHIPGSQRASNLKWCLTDTDSSTATIAPRATGDWPQYCCTKGARLGPYPNTSVAVGMQCVGYDPKGVLQHGKACK